MTDNKVPNTQPPETISSSHLSPASQSAGPRRWSNSWVSDSRQGLICQQCRGRRRSLKAEVISSDSGPRAGRSCFVSNVATAFKESWWTRAVLGSADLSFISCSVSAIFNSPLCQISVSTAHGSGRRQSRAEDNRDKRSRRDGELNLWLTEEEEEEDGPNTTV